jgi:hypothetical protein
MKTHCALATFAACIGFTAAAIAAQMRPTNLPDAFLFPTPPDGFDPVQASDRDLHAYGFPPRPNPFKSRRAYAHWAHMVGAARLRIEPILKRSNVRHRPMIPVGVLGPRAPLKHFNSAYSTNWSGEAMTTDATTFGDSSFYTLWGEFNVPFAQQQFGVCTGGTEYSSTWVGLDGYNNGPDIVQAGTESDATCANGATTGTYYPWFEWYPGYETQITNLAISPGDIIGAQVDLSTATSGGVFVTNETTNQYAAIGIIAPSGTSFVGNSAEWIVERPEIGKTLSTLQNYVTDFMSNTSTVLYGSNTVIYGGLGAPGIPISAVTMLDKNNNPLSVPLIWGGGGLVYHTEGAAK